MGQAARWRGEDCLTFQIPWQLDQQGGGMDKEAEVRRAKGLAAFQSFSNVWANQKLKLAGVSLLRGALFS
jgi:hypothetical protein